MEQCSERLHFDRKPEGSDKRGYFICSICECSLGVHVYYMHCPLLEDELICIDCCHDAVIEDSIIPKFKAIGLEYTREEIDEACRACGNREVPSQRVHVAPLDI